MTAVQDFQGKPRPVASEMPELFQNYMDLRFVHKAILISLKNRFVYVRVPKVANSSVKFSIYNNERLPGTSEIKERIIHDIHYGPVIRPGLLGFDSEILNEALFGDTFFRFTFVRNPYAKALSNFLDRYQAEDSSVRKLTDRIARRRRIVEPDTSDMNFSQFLQTIEKIPAKRMEIHISPQSTQLMIGLVDYHEICPFENITSEWNRIGSKLWKGFKPSFDNKSPSRTDAGQKLSTYFDLDNIRRVNRIYEQDFVNLGYKMLDRPEDFLKAGAIEREAP